MGRSIYVTHANGRSDATSSGDTNRSSNGRADHASGHTLSGCAIGYGNPRANGNRRTAARNDDGATADRRADAACRYFSAHAARNARATACAVRNTRAGAFVVSNARTGAHAARNARATACAARNTRAGAFVACNARTGAHAARNRGDWHGRAGPFTAHDRGASAGAVRYPAPNG